MEYLEHTGLSRRAFFRGCIGGLAASLVTERTTTALPPETNGGGMLCTEAPNEEGISRLQSIHENAESTVDTDRYDIAKYYGLTLVPQDVINNFINEDLAQSESPMEAVALLDRFTNEWLGFKVSVDLYATDADARKILTDISEAKPRLSALLTNLILLPQEFYQAIRFTELSISDLRGTGGDYTHSTGRVRLDPESIHGATVLYHELGHAANMTMCGESPDIAFIETLPEGVEYTDDWMAADVWRDIFVSPYGMQNDREDSAMVIAAWMTGRISLSQEKQGTPLYKKLAIIMDRFDTLLPGIVEYIEEAVRPAIRQAPS